MGDFWIGGTIQGPVIQLVIIGCCLGRVIGSVTISHAPRASLECPHWAGSGHSPRSRRQFGRTAEADIQARTQAGTCPIDTRGGKQSDGCAARQLQQAGKADDQAHRSGKLAGSVGRSREDGLPRCRNAGGAASDRGIDGRLGWSCLWIEPQRN